MEHEFWHERWQSGQLGFHRDETNTSLIKFWPRIGSPPGTTVFVPLCGKSLDMIWLAGQGMNVIANELSQRAIDQFFDENNLSRTTERRGDFTVSVSDATTPGRIEIWCGDFFTLPPDFIARADAVYDRGSLVALPTDMRADYVRKLTADLNAGTQILLLCVNYEQSEMNGPPFAIAEAYVNTHYGPTCTIEQLVDEKIADLPERYRVRGATWMSDAAYLLRKT